MASPALPSTDSRLFADITCIAARNFSFVCPKPVEIFSSSACPAAFIRPSSIAASHALSSTA